MRLKPDIRKRNERHLRISPHSQDTNRRRSGRHNPDRNPMRRPHRPLVQSDLDRNRGQQAAQAVKTAATAAWVALPMLAQAGTSGEHRGRNPRPLWSRSGTTPGQTRLSRGFGGRANRGSLHHGRVRKCGAGGPVLRPPTDIGLDVVAMYRIPIEPAFPSRGRAAKVDEFAFDVVLDLTSQARIRTPRETFQHRTDVTT